MGDSHESLTQQRASPRHIRWRLHCNFVLRLLQRIHFLVDRLEIDFETFSFEAGLKEEMLRLEPLQNPQNRYLITETRSRWTAIFSNSRLGSDITSAVSYLCKVLGCRGVEIQCSPSLTKREGNKSSIVSYAATSFTLVGPHETEWLNEIRHVSARKDGGRGNAFSVAKYNRLNRSSITKTNTFAIALPPRCWSPTALP